MGYGLLITLQSCIKMLRNLTFVVQFAYFCIRLNKGREQQKQVSAFFEQFSLQKAAFEFFLRNFWATFWEITGTFLGNLEQLTRGKPSSVSRVKKVIQQFYWLIRFFGFNWGQSYLAALVTPQNCKKCLEILLLLYNLYILASDPKTLCFFRATFEEFSSQKATFNCCLSNFWATFWEIPGNFLENLEQLAESPMRLMWLT